MPTEVAAGERMPEKLVVAVSDNSPSSRLNIEHISDVVANPEIDPALYELLGHPRGVRSVFGSNYSVNAETMTEDLVKVIEDMQHYATLIYDDQQGSLQEIERRLNADGRFAYAVIPMPWHFSSIPNDRYFVDPYPFTSTNVDFQWGSQSSVLHLPQAWDRNTGWAQVGLLDGGPAVKSDPSGNLLYLVDHPDLYQVVPYNLSVSFAYGYPNINNPRLIQNTGTTPHGTHTLGIIAANANNNEGVAGTCWHCSILYGQIISPTDSTPGTNGVALGLSTLVAWGAQVVNFSGGVNPNGNDCSVTGYGVGTDPTCIAMKFNEVMQGMFVAASGNNKMSPAQFPSRDAKAIGVSGSDVLNAPWDEQTWLPPDSWDFSSGPYIGCTNDPTATFFPYRECGTNSSTPGTTEIDFSAPARLVVSTLPLAAEYDPVNWSNCNDYNFPGPYAAGPPPYYGPRGVVDGYGYCTGTSMSAPYITGAVALLRSANPLLPPSEIMTVMKEFASGAGTYSNLTGWGRPNVGTSLGKVIGRVGGGEVVNRLTPMFVLSNATDRDRLYTTRPQTAAGALMGKYLTDVFDCVGIVGGTNCHPTVDLGTYVLRPYVSAPTTEAAGISSYSTFPGFINDADSTEPRASFWVFTSDKSPWRKVGLKPLYRLSFREPCDWRDHVYTTEQAGIDYYTQTDYCPDDPGLQSYKLDGIEGYVLDGCPPNYNCDNTSDPSAPQKLYRRYNYSQQMYALILAGQIGTTPFFGYDTDPNYNPLTLGVIGYVFPNVDSDYDGLPDGMERMYGMNRFSNNSDGDAYLDGVEFPITSLQPNGLDPLIP